MVAVTIVVAFMLGYAGGDSPREVSSQPKPAKAEKQPVPAARPARPVQLSPEEAKAREEQLKEWRAREKGPPVPVPVDRAPEALL